MTIREAKANHEREWIKRAVAALRKATERDKIVKAMGLVCALCWPALAHAVPITYDFTIPFKNGGSLTGSFSWRRSWIWRRSQAGRSRSGRALARTRSSVA